MYQPQQVNAPNKIIAAKCQKIVIKRFGGQVRLPKCNGGQVRWLGGRVGVDVDDIGVF